MYGRHLSSVLPHNFAGFRIQGHNGIVEPPNEHHAISVGNAMVVPATVEEEIPKLCLIVESVKFS